MERHYYVNSHHHQPRRRCSITNILMMLLIATLVCNIIFLLSAIRRLDPNEEFVKSANLGIYHQQHNNRDGEDLSRDPKADSVVNDPAAIHDQKFRAQQNTLNRRNDKATLNHPIKLNKRGETRIYMKLSTFFCSSGRK